MADENTQQSETPVETTVTETPSEAAPTQTLEEVYKQFNVDDAAQQFTAQPVQNTPPQNYPPAYQPPVQTSIPDPITDPGAYQQYMLASQQQNSALGQTINQLNSKLTQIEKERQQQVIDADIGKAVAKVNSKVKADPLMVELALEKKAREDMRFMKIWDNRHKNPKAWDAALEAVTNELQGKFSVRTDPQLTENQRALKASQRGMATSNQSKDDGWDNLSDSEFDKKWREAKNSF
jgi:hypothetical protein